MYLSTHRDALVDVHYNSAIIGTNIMKGTNSMSLTKQAKILTESQQKQVLAVLASRRNAARNTLMFLLSVDAGLRAKEIALLEWTMVLGSDGEIAEAIRLEDRASKGKSGGVVFMSGRVQDALRALGGARKGVVLLSTRGDGMSAQVVVNWFWTLYRDLGFNGASSHSGRRTAITRWARKISSVGGSMRDVQALARHSSLAMTQRYIEVSEDAMKRVV